VASDQGIPSTKSVDVSLFTSGRLEMPTYWQAGDSGRTLARDGFFARNFLGTGASAFVDEGAFLGMPNYRAIEPDLITPLFDTNDSDVPPAMLDTAEAAPGFSDEGSGRHSSGNDEQLDLFFSSSGEDALLGAVAAGVLVSGVHRETTDRYRSSWSSSACAPWRTRRM